MRVRMAGVPVVARATVGSAGVELPEVGCRVEVRVGDARDRERGAGEVGALAGGGERGEVLPQAAHSRLSASTRGGPLHQRGSQSSTTLPSGSRIQSWGPPKWR